MNGRNVGKEIYKDTDKVAAEYITYRKVGDHATNMPATVWFGSGTQIKDSIKYKYDSCGNICEITENGHIVAKYAYDSLNRLIREDNKAIGKTVLFTYDNAGNVTERCEYAYTSKSGEELSEQNCTHYSYDYDGDKLKSYNGKEITYNSAGNPTAYCDKVVEWQYGTRVVKFGDTAFAYDGAGKRTQKGNITFKYDSDGKLVKQSDGLEFIYDASGVVGLIYRNVQYFYRKDAQGNVVAILNASGNVVVKYVYDAWGNHKVIDVNGNEVISGIGVLNPFRYRGYYYDTETGLYYLQTRYYDPEVGRFISQDSVEYADPEKINGINLYAYCGNNPVMNVDPTGESFLAFLFLMLGVGLFAGAAVGGVSAAANGENVWDGLWKGAVVGILFGFSVSAIGFGVGMLATSSMAASIAIGAGVGSAFALGINLSSQLQNGGFGSLDMNAVGASWGIGLGVGAVAGVMSEVGKVIGATIGEQLGVSLAGKTFFGTLISSVIPKAFLFEAGSVIGGALGGYFAGKFINDLANDTGLQNQAVPLWFVNLIKKLFTI